MHALTYIAHVHEAEPGEFLVGFFDVPEAITHGGTLEEARANAADALAAALEGYLELGRPLPLRADVDPASAAAGRELIEVPVDPAIAARAILAQRMRDEGLSKVGLAQRMHRDEKVVRRILSGRGVSLDLTLEALRAVGVQPALAV